MSESLVVITVENGAALVLPESAFTERQRTALAHIVRHRGVDALPAEQAVQEQRQPSPTDRVSQVSAARAQGYTGECCQNALCGSFRVKRNGACTVCDDCGQTTGCS